MSQFFRALEQAERDRAVREQRTRPSTSEPISGAPSVTGLEPLSPLTPLRRDEAAPGSGRREAALDPASLPDAVAADAAEAVEEGVDAHLVSLLAPASFAAERYRSLRSVLEQLHRSTQVSLVGITSPSVGDGKTVTALNLAGALAQAPGARILLVEADLRRPSVERYLALGPERRLGLVDLLLDLHLKLADAITTCPPFGLTVLTAGQRPKMPYELLKSQRLAQVLYEARETYDYVVLDTPPLIPVPDCGVIGKLIDGFFVVVAAHRTPRAVIDEALRSVEPQKMLGMVFNLDEEASTRYYGPYAGSPDGDHAGGTGRGLRLTRWLRRSDRRG